MDCVGEGYSAKSWEEEARTPMERKGKKARHTTGRQEGGCLPAKKEIGGKQAF